ncbi:hypothetical protein RUM44_001071 [Polyplax serrata]|uniref:Glycosyltransferase 2-like domain-containing protein n=1 Tax=Polyplax serrata TaxID=468196 RepID=A0ABR1B9U1_POLSC
MFISPVGIRPKSSGQVQQKKKKRNEKEEEEEEETSLVNLIGTIRSANNLVKSLQGAFNRTSTKLPEMDVVIVRDDAKEDCN